MKTSKIASADVVGRYLGILMLSMLDTSQRYHECDIGLYSGHKDRKPNHIAAIVPTTNARLESGRRIGDWRKGLIVSATGMIARPTGTAAMAR
jgi:hypothetical protein